MNISLTCLRSRISTAIMELSGRNERQTVVEDLKVLPRTAMHTCSNYHIQKGWKAVGVFLNSDLESRFLSGIYAGRLDERAKNVLA